MQNKAIKILVLFVEPMLYGMDLIREVYEKTEYEFKYIYCYQGLTGKDGLELPKNSYLNTGNKKVRRRNILREIEVFRPDFMVINGYVGIEQTVAIRYCQKHRIPYAIETDTPLHVPENPIKAYLKKVYLSKMLNNKYCYGFPGGILQKENLVYYGIPEKKCFIMPMSVSSSRILNEYEHLPAQVELKKKYGLEGKYIFLYVGRLTAVKNVQLLLEAFQYLKAKQKNIALLVVGDGEDREGLENYVSEQRISHVQFMGYQVFPYLIEFYKVADTFVLPSNYESWGLVVNEAMVCSLPVIVSSAVGCRNDIIRDNGYIFENNSCIELVSKMERILNEDNLELRKKSRKIIAEWNYQKYLQNFKSAVESICES